MEHQSSFLRKFFLFFLVAIMFVGCSNNGKNPSPIIELSKDYSLVFQDEFDGEVLDTTVWGFHNIGKRRDAVNVKEACLINENGELEIRNWTKFKGNDTIHHAGMIETKVNFTFGYYEARIKFNIEMGSWGAFWIMYHNTRGPFTSEDNPMKDGVEIDIVEFVPTNSRYASQNLHWNGYGEFHQQLGTDQLLNGELEGYHVYSLLWTPEKYVFYIDGEPTWTVQEAISHMPEFVILSTEIEDKSWGGNNSIPKEGYGTFEDTKNIMYVDYVRVFQKNSEIIR